LPPIKNVFTDLENEVHQIWAEAVHYWRLGETLFLPEKVSLLAKEQQNLHRETSAKEGLIREFVERQIPINWDKRSQGDRRLYWSSEFGQAATDKVETTVRYKICAAEIWVECLGGDIKFMRRVDAIEINTVLSTIPGWVKHNEAYRFGPYGPQKGFLKL
jgi:predicted P-loop ATPase